jgi:hypothetical protein
MLELHVSNSLRRLSVMAIAKRWIMRIRNKYGGKMSPSDANLTIERAFIECSGQWLAVDRKSGEVKATASQPYELSAYIKSHQIHGVDIVRAPSLQEPEMVGFG